MSNELFLAVAGNAAGADTDANFENTVLLLNADGASDGGQNNTFRDVSGNGHTITRNGNVTQGSFSPFSVDDGKWGNYFDGASNNYLSKANDSNFAFGTGDFTVECWVYVESFASSVGLANTMTTLSTAAAGQWYFKIANSTTIMFGRHGAAQYVEGTTSLSTNTWYHIVAAREGTTFRLFVNGTVLSTTDTGGGIGSYDYNNSSGTLTTGIVASGSGGERMDGYISNFRIVKGTAVYTSAFTPSTTPLTAITNTSLLTCQSNRFVDNSTNDYALTLNGAPKVVPFSPFPQTTAYTQSVVNQGSVKFDGTDDSLVASYSSQFLYQSGDFTAEAWIYPESLTGGRSIVGVWGTIGASNNASWIFYINGSNIYWYVSTNGSTQTAAITAAHGMSINNWYHVALSRSSGTTRIFVNGSEVGNTSTVYNLYDSTSGLTIGRNPIGGTPDVFSGNISNVRIIKGTALYTTDFTVPTAPLEDITNTSLLTCQANGFVDNSSNAHTITVNGNPERTTNVPFGERSVEFDGTGDKLTIPSDTSLQLGSETNWTIEMWAQLVSTPANFDVILGKGTSGTFEYFIEGFADRTIDFLYSNNGSPWTGQHQITPAMTLGEWFHLAVVRNGASLKSYVNGVEYFSGSAGDIYVGSGLLGVGGYAYAAQDPNVILSNVRIVKGTSVYTADFTPPTEPLTAITNTSLLTCQNAVFQDNSGNAHAITASGDPQASTNLPFGERSVYFDGSGDGLSTAVDTSFNVGSNDFTIESFGYLTTAGQFNNIVSAGVDASNGYRLDISTSNNLRLLAYIGGSWSTVITGSTALTTGKWYHFAVTRSGNDFDLWVDGVSDATTVTNSGTIADPTTKIEVGAVTTNSLNRSFYGYLSNTRLVKGTAVYTSAFTPPTEPLTAVSGTSLLTCQDAVFQDNSGNAHAITVNGNAQASTNIPFAPVTTYGVQQYLDDAFTVSPQGGSAYFDGTGDYLTAPSNADFQFGTGDFTVQGWIYPMSNSASSHIFSHDGSSYGTWYISRGTDGRIDSWIYGDPVNSGTPGKVPLYAWTHVLVSRSGGVHRVFINGVVDKSYSTSRDITKSTFNINRLFNGAVGAECYLSDIRIEKGVGVTSATVPTAPLTTTGSESFLGNFTNASILDATGRNVIETVGNAQVDTTTVKYGTGAIELDGTGDYLIPNGSPDLFAFGTGDFTIEMWVRTTNLTNNNIVYDGRPFNINGNYITWYIGSNGSLNLFVNSAIRISGSASAISTNTWYHIAVSRSGTSTKMFIDGTQVGSTYTDSNNYLNTTSRPAIGISGGYLDNPLNGYMDDLRITKGIARYTTNFTPPTKALPVIGE